MNVDQAIELYKAQMERFDKTRTIQWTFNIAMWTLLMFGVNLFVGTGRVVFPMLALVLISIIFLYAHWRFVVSIQDSLQDSKRICLDLLTQINSLRKPTGKNSIQSDIPTITGNIHPEKKANKWIWFQIMATIVLLLCINIIHFCKTYPECVVCK